MPGGNFMLGKVILPASTQHHLLESFNNVDRNRDGLIDQYEMQQALSGELGQNFSSKTVNLLLYIVIGPNTYQINFDGYTRVYAKLEELVKSDWNNDKKIDSGELYNTLINIGVKKGFGAIDTQVFNVLYNKFWKPPGSASMKYDDFIACCLTYEEFTNKFKDWSGLFGASPFSYQPFMSAVLPMFTYNN